MMKLTEYLKELRIAHSYKQELIADHIGVSRQTYSAYETGRITPPISSIKRLAYLYNVSINSFTDKIDVSYDDDPLRPMVIAESTLVEDKIVNLFLEYINKHKEQLKYLTVNEKWLLFYYSQMNDQFKQEILTYLGYRLLHEMSNKVPKL